MPQMTMGMSLDRLSDEKTLQTYEDHLSDPVFNPIFVPMTHRDQAALICEAAVDRPWIGLEIAFDLAKTLAPGEVPTAHLSISDIPAESDLKDLACVDPLTLVSLVLQSGMAEEVRVDGVRQLVEQCTELSQLSLAGVTAPDLSDAGCGPRSFSARGIEVNSDLLSSATQHLSLVNCHVDAGFSLNELSDLVSLELRKNRRLPQIPLLPPSANLTYVFLSGFSGASEISGLRHETIRALELESFSSLTSCGELAQIRDLEYLRLDGLRSLEIESLNELDLSRTLLDERLKDRKAASQLTQSRELGSAIHSFLSGLPFPARRFHTGGAFLPAGISLD